MYRERDRGEGARVYSEKHRDEEREREAERTGER